MPDKYPTLCKTTTSTAGTADYVLDVAVLATAHRTPKQAVADGSLSDGDTIQYVVRDTTTLGDAIEERGEGVYTDATNTVTRTAAKVWDSPAGPGILYSWPGSGTRDFIIVDDPPEKSARTDRSNTFSLSGANSQIIQSTTASNANLALANSLRTWGIRCNAAGDFALVDQTSAVIVGVVEAAAPASSFYINSSGFLGLGGSAPTNFYVFESNTDTTPGVEVEQGSTGDAGLMFSIVGDCYAVGIDNSDSDLLKISYSGTAGGAVLGTNDILTIDGVTKNIGINKNPSAASGTLLSIKSTGNGTSPVQVTYSGSAVAIAALQESASGNGQLYVTNNAGTEFAVLATDTDPRLIFTTGGTNRFEIGSDATDNKLKIENSQSAFSSPLVTVDASRFELNTVLLSLNQTSTAADPTTTEYPTDGDVGVHHNTTSGNRFWVWNDGGVIYKVAMT